MKSINYKLIFILVLTSLLYWYVFDSKLVLNGDNVKYYLLSQSLLDGKYSSIWTPGEPKHTHFSFGYPALVALFPFKGIVATKILNGLFLLGSIVFLFLFFTRISTEKIATISCCIFATNATVLQYSSIMMSEISFIFFMSMGLYAFSRT